MTLKWHLLVFILGIILLDYTSAWRGNIASRVASRRKKQKYCAYSIRGRCCYYRYRFVTEYYRIQYCKSGWKHNGDQNCNIPKCNPECQNGGQCVRPNTCQCPSSFEGQYCEGIKCDSTLSPCYPGMCDSRNCVCQSMFSGPTCLRYSGAPSIDGCRTWFSYRDPAANFTTVFEHNMDATGSDDVEIIWTNQNGYNTLRVEFSIDFDLIALSLPRLPNYIRQFSFGVTEARISKVLKKRTDTGIPQAQNVTNTPCESISASSPIANQVIQCNIYQPNFFYRLDSGDEFLFTFEAKIGGFRQLDNGNRENYEGGKEKKELQFNFDFENPDHCIPVCQYSPFSVAEDITNTTIRTSWKGWTDAISGVERYTWEIFKLEPNMALVDLPLGELRPLSPIYITQVNHTSDDETYTLEYTPDVSGMYSIILEIADRANNSIYVRRLVLFDKDSSISLNEDYELYANSAANTTDYRWQTIRGNGQNSSFTRVSLMWSNRFVNRLYTENYLLNNISRYPPQLNDFGRRGAGYKNIIPKFDDNEGRRRTTSITNLQGIVKFQTAATEESTNALNSLTDPAFIDVLGLKEVDEIELQNVQDGSAFRLWIRAYDIIGNIQTDSTLLQFDSSAPLVNSAPEMINNVDDGEYPFSSRVTVNVSDFHSGMLMTRFQLVMNDTGYIKQTMDVPISPLNTSDCVSTDQCYTTPMGVMYGFNIQVDINHCWMRVEQEKLDTQVMTLRLEFFNSAYLSISRDVTISSIRALSGIEDYAGPMNVSQTRQLATGVSLTWVHSPSCYDRMTILIEVMMPDGSTKMLRADRDAVRFDVTGLFPGTSYETRFYTVYKIDDQRNITSTPVIFIIVTAAAPEAAGIDGALSTGGIVGLVIGLLLLFIIILVIILLWRTGRLETLIKGKRQIHIANITHGTHGGGGAELATLRRGAGFADIDEVDMGQSLYINRELVTLEREIKRGRFAIIYLAKLRGRSKDLHTVAAKVLLENWTERDEEIMKEKMEFHVNEVGQHPNILGFIGGVQDPHMGAFMILEYCENGTLKEYLQKNKHHVTEDLQDKLFQFSYETCRGMEYLAGKEIFHRRLAARNVMLTFRFTVKISGFGPMPKEDEQEKLPVKWLPPECIAANSTRYATTEADVWSYGIVLWEIFSMGENPYNDVQTEDMLQYLRDGKRLKKPEYSDSKLYEIMRGCWSELEAKRPRFIDIRSDFDTMFRTSVANLPTYDTQEVDEIYFDTTNMRR